MIVAANISEEIPMDALDLLIADHNRVRGLFHQFEQASDADDRSRMSGEEERELFPKVRTNSDSAWRKQLGERLDTRKGELSAPVLADRDDLSVEDLKSLASSQDIPGRSKMSSTELRATVAPE
jgi:hypothetical protein